MFRGVRSANYTMPAVAQSGKPQEHVLAGPFVTLGLPVRLISIVLFWLPTVGVARQSVSVAAVAPAPVGWNTMLVAPPDSDSRKPFGSFAWLKSTVVPACTTQPFCQPPEAADSVTVALRLIASLRAS